MRSYQEVVNWMFGKLPMFQKIGGAAYRKDLDNIIAFSKHLKNPEKSLQCIHIAGTNGKGSTSSMLASILQECGFIVGLYTSPHLKDYRERIKINGNLIEKSYIKSFINKNYAFLEKNQLSFFEMSVGLAFSYFKDKKVDFAIIEVGMGGRLDATNIINPLLSIITNISQDHTQFLGSSLDKIAFEKAGIIKQNTPVVIGEYDAITKKIFLEKSKNLQANITFAQDIENKIAIECPLEGDYQAKNIKTVLAACLKLIELKIPITTEKTQLGISNVIKNTGLRGRWEILKQKKPKIICDTAHNEAGIALVIQQLKKEVYTNLHIVLGMVNDKEIEKMLCYFPQDATYYFVKPNIPRGLASEILLEKATQFNLKGKNYSSVFEGYQEAKKVAQKKDLIFVGGSTFVVAEIL